MTSSHPRRPCAGVAGCSETGFIPKEYPLIPQLLGCLPVHAWQLASAF